MHSLTPIQLAVLGAMAASGNDYAPSEAATMDKYRKAMRLAGLPPKEAKADVPGVQQALIALQEKKAGMAGGARRACAGRAGPARSSFVQPIARQSAIKGAGRLAKAQSRCPHRSQPSLVDLHQVQGTCTAATVDAPGRAPEPVPCLKSDVLSQFVV